MFRGPNKLNLDSKGRLVIPSRYRERLSSDTGAALVLTLNPFDRSLWVYPLAEWATIDDKLTQLSDSDKQSRRAKQMMRGYASDCQLDGQCRILIPRELRNYAKLTKRAIMFGQGNKFEIWDEATWNEQHDQWLKQVSSGADAPSDALSSISL